MGASFFTVCPTLVCPCWVFCYFYISVLFFLPLSPKTIKVSDHPTTVLWEGAFLGSVQTNMLVRFSLGDSYFWPCTTTKQCLVNNSFKTTDFIYKTTHSVTVIVDRNKISDQIPNLGRECVPLRANAPSRKDISGLGKQTEFFSHG